MGFPTWTLWGMGLSSVAALIAVSLAFLAQSPRLLSRLNLTRQRLDLRARSLTGYGLAFLLLAFGFFVAGVPLDREATTTADPSAGSGVGGLSEESVAGTIDAAPITATVTIDIAAVLEGEAPPSGNSGAVIGLASPEPGEVITETQGINVPPGAEGGELAPTARPTATDEPTLTPSPFPTVTPTPTPSPTLTPTPIYDPTARIGDDTSTLPVRRLPGGEILAIVLRGDTVILLPGHAFHTGQTWREISTVDGAIGWVPERYLVYEETTE